MNFLKQGYYFFIYTNLLIGGAAAAQCALTYIFFESAFNYSIIAIEGAATLLLYNFSLVLSKPKDPKASIYRRTRWVFQNEWILWLNSALAGAVLLYTVYHLHIYNLLFLTAIGGLSMAYSFPIFPYRGKMVGLRQLPGMKIFHIALVWTLSSVCLPAFQLHLDGLEIDHHRLLFLFLLKFVFLIICTLPFDIRDIQQDSYYHLKTIPSMLGAEKAINLCYLLLGLHSLGIVIADFQFPVKIGILLTNILIGIVLKRVVFRNRDRYHYAYLLDFALIVQFIFVACSVAIWSYWL
ncbi:hypothetical protein [Sphingobacterium suaedae]|uniref:Prenyltransferase n=1 Tax=Sphingobacterium suaedae TaxID=1686402 RepID=A0ABW5KKJ7_9SPHI